MSLIVSYISIAGRLRQQGVSVCVCGAVCVPDCQLHQCELVDFVNRV